MNSWFTGTFCFFATCFVSGALAQSSCSFSTYLGGTQSDEVKSVLNDAKKNTYVFGNTYSPDLPVSPGLINDSYSGSYDAFLAKFDSCGSLVWCTYLGGPNFDSAEKMALTTDGNLILCGYTNSLNTFTTSGCFQSNHGGGYDAFISKVDTSGHLLWSSLFGKAGGDFAYDICVDKLNNIIVGGTTSSTGLYTVAGTSFQVNLKGNTDAFIARFSPAGMLAWCTYYGGNNSEDIHVVTTDANCHIIGAGGSFSTNLNTSPGAHQSLNDGGVDGYIIKLDSNGTRVFSSYLGGSGVDDIWGVACDAASNIYLAGHTNSTDFDTTAGAFQVLNKGLSDLYLSKWSPGGSLLQCTLFGGSQTELLGRMLLSGPYEVTLGGKTESADIAMSGNSLQPALAGSYDLLFVKFDTGTLMPVWSSYYGGAQDEELFDLTGDMGHFMTFAGSSNSSDFPLSPVAYQQSLNASSVDGYVARLNVGNQVTTALLEQKKNTGSFRAFPNPFSDVIHLESAGLTSVALYDIAGRNMFPDIKPSDLSILNTSAMAPGMYFLVFTDAQGRHCVKMCH